MKNASGAMKLGASMKAGFIELLTRPHAFISRPEFRIILGVYFSTYAVANSITSGELCRPTKDVICRPEQAVLDI